MELSSSWPILTIWRWGHLQGRLTLVSSLWYKATFRTRFALQLQHNNTRSSVYHCLLYTVYSNWLNTCSISDIAIKIGSTIDVDRQINLRDLTVQPHQQLVIKFHRMSRQQTASMVFKIVKSSLTYIDNTVYRFLFIVFYTLFVQIRMISLYFIVYCSFLLDSS